MSLVDALADWAAGLRPADIPDGVRVAMRAQRRSVFAAIAAAATAEVGKRYLDSAATWASPGPVELLPGTPGMDVEDAVALAAGLSLAAEFDDYIPFGHPGHAAVVVPAVLAAAGVGDSDKALVAQAAADEMGGRLGGACMFGPVENGQLGCVITAAGTAVAAGVMIGLDRRQLAHALALALTQVARPSANGHIGTDARVLTAAHPATTGVRAARLAEAGVRGPLDILDEPGGVLDWFCYEPQRAALGGLGVGWITEALSVKCSPCSVYLNPVVDAVQALGPLDPDEVLSIDVRANFLTYGSSLLGERARGNRLIDPRVVAYSAPMVAALTVTQGELPVAVTSSDPAARLARRVRVFRDADASRKTAGELTRLIAPGTVLRSMSPLTSMRVAVQMVAGHPEYRFRPVDMAAMTAAIGARLAQRPSGGWWAPEQLEAFRLAFPVKVEARLRNGKAVSAAVEVARGARGHEVTPTDASREKLARWGPSAWGEAGTRRLAAMIDEDVAGLPLAAARR